MAAQYRFSVDIFTSPPASNLLTTEAEVPIRAATIVCDNAFFSRSVSAARSPRSLVRQLASELTTFFRLRHEARKFRVATRPLVDDHP